MKWKRVRPGLYEARMITIGLLIERGAETRRWWWTVFDLATGEPLKCDYEWGLKQAKADAERASR